jgi:arylsulfatase A-like enzyme
MRWPGKIPAGVVANDICSHLDMLPTLLSIAGEPDIKEKLLRGHEAVGRSCKVHIDGHDLVPFLTVEGERSPRLGYFYFSDDGDLVALPVRQLEGGVHGAACARHAADLGRAVRTAAPAEALQPPHGPVRTCRHHVQHVLRLVPRPRLPHAGRHRRS